MLAVLLVYVTGTPKIITRAGEDIVTFELKRDEEYYPNIPETYESKIQFEKDKIFCTKGIKTGKEVFTVKKDGKCAVEYPIKNYYLEIYGLKIKVGEEKAIEVDHNWNEIQLGEDIIIFGSN